MPEEFADSLDIALDHRKMLPPLALSSLMRPPPLVYSHSKEVCTRSPVIPQQGGLP